MKNLIILITALFALTANAKTVYKCVDGIRSFEVRTNNSNITKNHYVGIFQDFTGKPTEFDCVKNQTKIKFICTKDEYIVNIFKNSAGKMMVHFELAGDFFPDSGYLYGINCEL